MAASSSRSRQVPFLVGLVLILAALPLGWFVFLREPPAPPPPPAPVPVAAVPLVEKRVELELSTFEGLVEVRHGDGEWSPAQKGMPLRPTDAVRTGDGAYAVLVNGEAVEVRMDAGTEVSVEELTDSLSRLLLGNGIATATVRPGKRQTFELKTKGSDAVARTGGGTFTMSNNGQGTVKLGTREGEVTLLGKGKVVIVRAGQESIVRPGQEPSDPVVPNSLLLMMKWPEGKALRQREVVVTGRTDPGSMVEVGGATVRPDANGDFQHKVVLQEGHNSVQVRAKGVGGVSVADQRDLLVDTKKPPLKVKPEDIWKTAKDAPR